MSLHARTALGLIVLSLSVAAQVPAPRARIEGVILQAGGVAPQPVVGATITVTKVNGTTGANLPILGGAALPTIASSNASVADFPGMPAVVFGPDGLPQTRALPQPPPTQTTHPVPPVTTGPDGRFVVPDLEEGAYRLLVIRNGYVRQEFGQRVFPGQGMLINLTAGQVFNSVTMRLTPTGNVNGRIIDDNGQPAVSVNLQLLKAIYNANGQRIFQSAGSARTDDRGDYRFYWVTPGRYYVAGGNAAATFTFGGGPSPNEPVSNYMLTYYPGVADLNRATAVEVTSGSELAVDFVTPRQKLYTISGKVVQSNPVASANGQIPAVTLSLAFRLLTGNAGTFTMTQAYEARTGTFVMRNVLPGSYVLQAAAPPSYARVPVEITNSDVDGLVISLDNSVTINGRFVSESGDLPPLNTLRSAPLRPMTNGAPNFLAVVAPSPAAADGSFTISNVVPGQYRAIALASQDFYVKEVRYNRADALNTPVEISARNSGTMEVVISRNVGQIDGVIVDDRGQPVVGVQAVLIPDSRERIDLYKTATTDQRGHYTIRGVIPGDYKLYAWEGIDAYGYFDPDVMRSSDRLGTPARVAESSALTVQGKVIPAAAP